MKCITWLPLAALVALTTACNDVVAPTRPDVEPSFAKSGTGHPKFARQFTNCTDTSALISCNFKISGLGNTDLVDIFLTGTVHVEADCQNHGGNVAPGQAFETTVTGAQLDVRPENGQITSSISIRASDAPDPVASEVCPNPHWTVVNVRKTFTGDFTLFAVVEHQDGSTTRIESGF